MSPTDELIHCFAHSELGHGHHRLERIDVRHLQQFAFLICRYRDEIDWGRLEILQRHPRYGQIFTAYIFLAKMLFRAELPLSTDSNPFAERHYRAVTSVRSGWCRRKYLLWKLLRELFWVFSKERLQEVYRQKDVPIIRLRLRHLRFLLGRYCRLEAWRERLRAIS
jgi:hypothetical protein